MAVSWQNGVGQLLLISRSTNGTDWQVMTQIGFGAGLLIITVTPNHDVCLVWRQSTSNCPNRSLFFSKSSDRGTNWTTPAEIQCFYTNNFELARFSGCDANDYFRAAPVPRFAANPANGDLYYVYHDKPDISTGNPNIYFIQSTNGGDNWSQPIQVNIEPTNSVPTDQWQTALAVKPDGTQLFIAWYDRRNDPTNQSLIETYGVFSSLPITNSANFGTNFVISTAQFLPAFTGTNLVIGSYDPVYPPRITDSSDIRYCTSFDGTYRGFTGNDYHTAFADGTNLYFTWSDNRRWSTNQSISRPQADIRFVRLPW